MNHHQRDGTIGRQIMRSAMVEQALNKGAVLPDDRDQINLVLQSEIIKA